MKITDVRTYLLTARWAADPFFPVQLHSTALVEICTDQGLTGVGETIMGYFVPDSVAPMVDFYKPLLIGQDPDRIRGLWERLYIAGVYWGRSGAGLSVISAIDMALWDLKGKAAGVPVYQLLGGLARPALPLYCSGGPALWPIADNIAKCKYYVEQGYRALKFATGYYIQDGPAEMPANWRIKPTPTANIGPQEGEKCEAVRNALGPDIDIILDGHQGGVADPFSFAQALQVVEAVAPYGLLFFEEPLPYTDPAGYAQLRRHGRVPIAGGESLSGIHDFARYFDLGSLDIAQPEVTFTGGITACRDIAADAATRNLRVAMHCGGTAGPGQASSIHLSFATPVSIILEHVTHAGSVQKDFMLEPIALRDGVIAPPTAPGLGLVEISDALLAKYPYIPGTGEVC